MTRQLNDKEAAFVTEYLIDLNASRAAIRAGYAKTTADKKACFWVAPDREKCPEDKRHVWDAVQVAKQARCERTKIDADYVLKRLVEVDQMDLIDIMEDDGGLKPVSEWPKIWRQFIQGMDLTELFEGRGEDREMIGFLKKIKWPDKVKNLELIGKHVNVQAFKERIETTEVPEIEKLTDDELDAEIERRVAAASPSES